jgi:hypothetical protein
MMKLSKTFLTLVVILCSLFAICNGEVTAQNMTDADKARWVASSIIGDNAQLGASIYDAGTSFISKVGAKPARILLGGLLQGTKNPAMEVVADVMIGHFADAYNLSGVGNWNESMLKNHQNQLAGMILSKMDFVGTVHDLTRLGSARMIMPLSSESKVSKDCYEDSMDVLDAVNEMQRNELAWARTSK